MRHPKSSLAVSFVGLLCLPVMLLISGCSQSFESASGVSEPVAVGADTPGAAIAGTAFGGGLPDAYASVYLYAAAESGYGVASIPLLTSNVPSVCTAAGAPDPTGAGTSPCKDSNGNYFAVTSATGSWSIASDWTCPAANPYVYVLIVGGNTGAGINPNASFMTALAANCNTIPTHVYVNEATTVASVYALSGFMSSPHAGQQQQHNGVKDRLGECICDGGQLGQYDDRHRIQCDAGKRSQHNHWRRGDTAVPEHQHAGQHPFRL